MKAALAAFAVLLSVSTANAGEKKEKKDEAPQQYVAISPVALPVVVNNKVVNYVFVNVRIDLNQGADASKLREREPYFRDALVRAAHRTPFTLQGDYTKIDEAKLKAAVARDAAAIAGPTAIRAVQITSQAPKSSRNIGG
jgi:flagellar basal body-associated protein FliL